MAYKRAIPWPVAEGGIGSNGFGSQFEVVISAATTTDPITHVSGLGSAGEVLTSTGVTTAPEWDTAPTTPTNVVFDLMASDPGSPAAGDTWFNTTSNSFKGYGPGAATVTFTVT